MVPADMNNRVQLVENSNMTMISALLNGQNWLTWSRLLRIALEGKDKLGFIDGSKAAPDDGSTGYKQWRVADSVVRTWILSTISKEIVNAVLFAPTARALWVELQGRYAECKWTIVVQNKTRDRVDVASQILVLDPLQNVNKAYSMITKVERQRQVNMEFAEVAGQTAFQVKGYAGNRPYMKKKGLVDKRNLICEHCRKPGHTKDTCFKIHGVPDWYKNLSDQQKNSGLTNRAYTAVEPEPVGEIAGTQGSELVAELMEALRLV
ncbi:UNVERIFIED_CONTAM: hypothetical protein Slati_3842200 [Sesamum latifolium]|uniref:Retrotransposon Copia-like N-terminal domain-containing protein n=1 Tax=Sesamum latifolium TaxID=2727402 RepID=A0AAW2TK14_9LAMI